MKIFLTGGTGQIGRRLVADRVARGDQIIALSRDRKRAMSALGNHDNSIDIITGDPTVAGPWQSKVAGCDVAINLAGAGVADRRWSEAYKQKLIDSRVLSTRHVVDAMASVENSRRPNTLISASAVGYYGDGGERELDEHSSRGDDFLAKLAASWEAEATRAGSMGVRVALPRMSMVLDEQGGALPKMLKLFRLGIGGPLGRGDQFMPWIHWQDVIRMIDWMISNTLVRGPVNVVSPHQVRNREFAKALGAAVGRPAVLRAPAAGLRVVLGEFAGSVLASQRVSVAKATGLGYTFAYPRLEPALESLLAS